MTTIREAWLEWGEAWAELRDELLDLFEPVYNKVIETIEGLRNHA